MTAEARHDHSPATPSETGREAKPDASSTEEALRAAHWTMKRGYPAGDIPVSDLGPPPSGPAGGARPSEVVPRAALEASEARVRELREALTEIEGRAARLGTSSRTMLAFKMGIRNVARAALSSPSGVGGRDEG